jgi:hypothetical protein
VGWIYRVRGDFQATLRTGKAGSNLEVVIGLNAASGVNSVCAYYRIQYEYRRLINSRNY